MTVDLDKIRALLQRRHVPASHYDGCWDEHVEWLLDEVEQLREVLVFADGASVTGLGLALADLYSSTTDLQGVLSRAGCHPRGTVNVEADR